MKYLSPVSYGLLATLWLGIWGGAQAAGGFTTGADCARLKDYLVETALAEAEFYQGLGWEGWLWLSELNSELDSAPIGGEETAPEHSETNVQEAGADEPDLVKSDGDYIYLLSGRRLLILDSWPAADTREISRSTIEGNPSGLILAGDTAVVFSYVREFGALPLGFAPATYSLTKLTLFDLADRNAPRVTREIYLEGHYNTARLIDGRVHLVVSGKLHTYDYDTRSLPAYPEGVTLPPREGLVRGLVRPYGIGLKRRPIEELVPRLQDLRHTASGVATEVLPIGGCDSFYLPEEPIGTGTLSVVTLDLADPLGELRSATVIGDNGEVYASRDNLYVVSYNDGIWHAMEEAQQGPRDYSLIYKFRLGSAPEYRAFGKVPGWILDRYSLSERRYGEREVLRIATTEGERWWWWGVEEDPKNRLYTLVESSGRLEVLGTLDGLGHKGEVIYAVRYDGDRGYVVTFRRTDPLYTLDLSDPADPRTVGELEIPGFSTYLHPIGGGWLLAVGRNTELGGVDLSLFDVRDPAAPALADREFLGIGSWSEAMYNPKAFTYFAPLGQLVVPTERWDRGPMLPAPGGASGYEYFSGAILFDVDTATGLNRRGTIYHEKYRDDLGGWQRPGAVRRSIYIGDGDGYALFSIGDNTLHVNDPLTLGELTRLGLPGDRWEHPLYVSGQAVKGGD